MEQPGRPTWAPETVDIERPNAARMYDYYLGGSHNFAVDRRAAREMIAAVPEAPLMAQANRAFLRRAVRYLTGVGIRQFLDIGSGIPTVGNVHEIAQETAPDARVAYVDVDPVAVTHSRVLLAGDPRSVAVEGDVREPEEILRHPEIRELFDPGQPLAVMIVAVLHYVPESADPAGIVRRIRRGLGPGSYLLISQPSQEGRPPQEEAVTDAIYRRIPSRLTGRSRAEVERLFAGFELVEPGVVFVPAWHPDGSGPDEDPSRAVFVGGLGRVP
jgi:SAM-dependent methyltransferase